MEDQDHDAPPGPQPDRLVNATGKPIWVQTPIGCLPLPQQEDTPTVHDFADDTTIETRHFQIVTGVEQVSLPLRVSTASPGLTTEVPEPEPGVAYLVAKEILLRYPRRTD